MRNTFSELVAAGVASFKHEPIASEEPVACPICRTYNNIWGILTDTHAAHVGTRIIITGSLDEAKWEWMKYASHIGGASFKGSGFFTLSEFLYSYHLLAVVTNINGQMAIELKDYPQQETTCADCACACYITSESKFPQPIARLGDVVDCLDARSLSGIADNLNRSKRVLGEHWHVCDDKIIGEALGHTVILEVKFDRGTKVENEELAKLLDNEGLSELYFRNFGKYFALDSDDKKWQALLRKDKCNKVYKKNFDDLTPLEWFDIVKQIIACYN